MGMINCNAKPMLCSGDDEPLCPDKEGVPAVA